MRHTEQMPGNVDITESKPTTTVEHYDERDLERDMADHGPKYGQTWDCDLTSS